MAIAKAMSLPDRIDRLMRNLTGDSARPGDGSPARRHAIVLLSAGLAYGAVMGTFGGVNLSRLRQIVYSSAKAPLLLMLTFSLSLPCFFVLNTLLGLRAEFRQALRALVSAQATLTVVLASLSPFTALWYLSIGDYEDAVFFNAAMFAIASFAAQITLRRFYRSLIASNRRHLWMLRAWLAIFAFVGIQVGWVLRPYIGVPNLPTRFLRADAMTNAYISVARMIWEKLR